MLGIGAVEGFIDVRSNLLKSYSICYERYQRGKQDEARVQQLETQILKDKKELDETVAMGNHMGNIFKNIKSYSLKHAEKARSVLDLAIEEAGALVPDAYEPGVHLKSTENNRVAIVNEKGQNVNLREGGGYRVILGALMRYAALKAQPDAMQLMLYDEHFFTLSDTTTAAMKDIFERMKNDVTIICIEQRRNAMDGILDSEYTFKKNAMNNTIVTKTM